MDKRLRSLDKGFLLTATLLVAVLLIGVGAASGVWWRAPVSVDLGIDGIAVALVAIALVLQRRSMNRS